VTDPLLRRVRHTLETGSESFYLSAPRLPAGTAPAEWLDHYEQEIARSPFHQVRFESTGRYDRALRYVPETRTLIVNKDHPFVDKLLAGGSNRSSATLFGSSEIFMDVLLQDHGASRSVIMDFLGDRVLRLLAGEHPSMAKEVLDLHDVVKQN